MSIRAIRVCNLRGIEDSDLLELKPINFMLGCNSAGKSTISRMFPLFKQSVEAQTTGPILWYGRLVDFGDIRSSIRKEAVDKKISFVFNGSARPNKRNVVELLYRYGVSPKFPIRNFVFDAEIDLKEGIKRSTLSTRYNIKAFGCEIEVHFSDVGDATKLFFDGVEVDFFHELKIIENRRGIYKSLAWVTEKGKHSVCLLRILSIITGNVHHKTSGNTLFEIFARFGPCSFSDFQQDVMRIYEPKSWRTFVRDQSRQDALFNLWKFIQLLYFPSVLEAISAEIRKTSLNVKYTRPLRASVERYYRSQDLAITEVDSEGKNLQVYLNSLSPRRRADFQLWLENNFNISAEATYNEGHISISLHDKDSGDIFNMADMGFGFSQVLPILTQLWEILYNCNEEDGTIVYVIEQPELHLHPRMQAKMMRVFSNAINAAKERKIDLKIIAETHSEAMVNKVGMLIRSGDLKCEDVVVNVFDRVSGQVVINQSSYNEKGALVNWPVDFFDY